MHVRAQFADQRVRTLRGVFAPQLRQMGQLTIWPWSTPSSDQPSVDLTEVFNAETQLRNMNTELRRLEESARVNPAVAREIGKDLITARNRHTALVAEYQRLRTLLGWQPATGLGSSLGAVPVAAIAILASIVAAIPLLWKFISAMQDRERAALLREQNTAAIIADADKKDQAAAALKKQAAAASAAGDVEAAREYLRQADQLEQQASTQRSQVAPQLQPRPQEGILDFLQRNAIWVLGGVAAAVIVPRLLDR